MTLLLLFFFEGFAASSSSIVALDLLGLGQGSVGFLNATWGIGALLGAMALAMLLDRGRLVIAIAGGSLLLGLATMLPGIWPDAAAAYLGWLGIGIGLVFVEVAAKTLMQRLGSDETLGRVIGSLESGRQAALALGSIGAVLLVELLGIRGSLIALGALMPVFVIALLDPAARPRDRRPGRRGALPAAARRPDLRAAAGGGPGAPQPRPRAASRSPRART